MRIVSGRFRGKALAAPKGEATRPTSERARQAIFNILEHAAWSKGVRDARVIDLFAGSGALGFEALSRGAAFCLFVETDADARGAIAENLETLGLMGQARVHRRDATALGQRADGNFFGHPIQCDDHDGKHHDGHIQSSCKAGRFGSTSLTYNTKPHRRSLVAVSP